MKVLTATQDEVEGVRTDEAVKRAWLAATDQLGGYDDLMDVAEPAFRLGYSAGILAVLQAGTMVEIDDPGPGS